MNSVRDVEEQTGSVKLFQAAVAAAVNLYRYIWQHAVLAVDL